MSFIQENKLVINIGLNKEYKLIHFSDVHLITFDETSLKEEVEKAIKQEEAWYNVRVDFARHFNEYYSNEHLIPSKECLDKLIEYSNLHNPDCVLMSGDIIDYYSESNLNYLKESLHNLNCNYLFCCGNHDNEECYDVLSNNNREFNYIDFEEFLVISIDNSNKKFSINQLNKLKELVNLNKPIILLMHIPVVTEYNQEEMKKFDSYFVIDQNNCDNVTKKFINYICGNENIKVILCGHVHGTHQSYFGKSKIQICASSGLIGYVNNITLK